MSIFIIAEIGINHNGDINIAKKMIDEAKISGVDCVKFQTFKANEFVSDPKQTYTYKSQGKDITESMLEMFKRYEFSHNDWIEIIEYCKQKEIVFCSTAQNKSDLDYLLKHTDLPFIKVGSDDLTNLDLMEYYASKQKPMIISAGMAYAYEIEEAVNTIRKIGNQDITVLHCISSYPTEAKEVNLKKIPVIRDAFGVKVGFSDHTIGNIAAIGSVCYGANVIEKHFTLNKSFPGPDHWFSIDPIELKRYVKDIRDIESAIGSPVLNPTKKEMEMRVIARRKIVTKNDLIAGMVLSKSDIDFKRHEKEGIEPKYLKFLLNGIINKNIKKGNVITLKDIR